MTREYQSALLFAGDLLASGASSREVEQALRARGLDAETATAVVTEAQDHPESLTARPNQDPARRGAPASRYATLEYRSALLYASDLLASGASPHEVEQSLCNRGLDAVTAVAVVTEAQQQPESVPQPREATSGAKQIRRAAINVLVGGLIGFFGLLYVCGSIDGVRGRSDNSNYIALAAIVWGAVQFLCGLSQSSGGGPPNKRNRVSL